MIGQASRAQKPLCHGFRFPEIKIYAAHSGKIAPEGAGRTDFRATQVCSAGHVSFSACLLARSFRCRGFWGEGVGDAVAAIEGNEAVHGQVRLAAYDDECGARVGVADEQTVGDLDEALALVGEQRREQRAARRVPELDRLVPPPRRDAGAVRRERD